MKYAEKPRVDIPTVTYQIGILLKKSKLLISEHTDQQLLKEVTTANQNRETKKRSPSPNLSFGNVFKRRDSVASDTSGILQLDLNIRKSKN